MDLQREPRGAEYRDLLAFLGARAASFSLVWRPDCDYGGAAEVVRHRLAPFLLRTEGTSTWPGTEYLGGVATVRHYRVVPGALRVLGEAPSLFTWQAPDCPEDLAFYGADGAVLFGSIAHEAQAWFEPGGVPESEVALALPRLVATREP